jgi:putative nucleotidyltransferase with HDIG domain
MRQRTMERSKQLAFDYTKLPREFPRRYLPAGMGFEWAQLSRPFDELKGREIRSVEDLKRWLADQDELDAVVYEQKALRMVNVSRQTDDAGYKSVYMDFLQNLEPRIKISSFELLKKYVASSCRKELPPQDFGMLDRYRENATRVFREENVELEKKDAEFSEQYQTIRGAMMVSFRGEERTLQQMSRFYEETDRGARREAWELSEARLLKASFKEPAITAILQAADEYRPAKAKEEDLRAKEKQASDAVQQAAEKVKQAEAKVKQAKEAADKTPEDDKAKEAVKQAETELHQSLKNLRTTLKAAIDSLASAIEMRDPYTAGHQERVTRLASAIAAEMGLAEDRIECIQIAGIIHDIGKLYVPAEILSKPTKLNEIEYSMIKMHAEVGYTILSKIDFPWPIARIVHQHHEYINGSGYPQGLSGKDILLEAKILCVADVVEAMSSHRPYRPALGLQAALEEISRKRGILFDREVVDACLRVLSDKKFKFD